MKIIGKYWNDYGDFGVIYIISRKNIGFWVCGVWGFIFDSPINVQLINRLIQLTNRKYNQLTENAMN